jgi:hypothetical protein
MTVFTHDQMHRPIFEEPSSEIENADEWSGPFGFLFGGMATLSLSQLGQQYFDAADNLVELVKRQEVKNYALANPILYLYRHSIELFLKAVLPDSGRGARHNLLALSERFETFVRDEFEAQVPDWIVTRIKELAQHDPDSTTFRYNQNAEFAGAGEHYIGLVHLQTSMRVLNTALVGAVAAVAFGEGKSAQ